VTDLVADLRTALGADSVRDPIDFPSALVGYRGVHRGDAMAIVRPRSTAEVAAAVGVCIKHGASIVAQGGNTGLAGGSVPIGSPVDGSESVIISTARLDHIQTISRGATDITVGCGVTIEAVQLAARGAGMMFAPDWGARGSATVGGAISTNAGGINVLAFGTFRSHVLGLEVVLPDGRIWNGLRSLRKDSSGYDLKQLFIGAEGTLGIATRATLSLGPALPHQSTALAAIRSVDDLTDLIVMARSATNATVTALELIPEFGAAAVRRKTGRPAPLSTTAEWYLLVRYSGTSPVEFDLASFLERAANEGLVTDGVVAATPRQSDELWFIRDELPPPGLMPDHDLAVKLDSAVPVARVAEFIDEIQKVCRITAPAAVPYIFGHVGDGNLHVHVLAPPEGRDRAKFLERRSALHRALDELTWSLGGTISAEHGIGRELRDRIADQKPPIEFELMRTIKASLDPHDLFNPGKTIPEDPSR